MEIAKIAWKGNTGPEAVQSDRVGAEKVQLSNGRILYHQRDQKEKCSQKEKDGEAMWNSHSYLMITMRKSGSKDATPLPYPWNVQLWPTLISGQPARRQQKPQVMQKSV
jgi:hypothetical protein